MLSSALVLEGESYIASLIDQLNVVAKQEVNSQ
jgi:hypothetical protein